MQKSFSACLWCSPEIIFMTFLSYCPVVVFHSNFNLLHKSPFTVNSPYPPHAALYLKMKKYERLKMMKDHERNYPAREFRLWVIEEAFMTHFSVFLKKKHTSCMLLLENSKLKEQKSNFSSSLIQMFIYVVRSSLIMLS